MIYTSTCTCTLCDLYVHVHVHVYVITHTQYQCNIIFYIHYNVPLILILVLVLILQCTYSLVVCTGISKPIIINYYMYLIQCLINSHVHVYILHSPVFPPKGGTMALLCPLVLKLMQKNNVDQTSCTTDAFPPLLILTCTCIL